VTEVSPSLSLLARMAGVDVVFGKRVDVREPVVLSDQFDSSGNAGVFGEGRVMVFLQDVHTQRRKRFPNVDRTLAKE